MMTDGDRKRFAQALYVLGEVFNEPVSEVRAEGYFDSLKDLDLEAVLAACRHAMATQTFFPRPAELRTTATGSVEDQAERAWCGVRREVRRVGYLGEPIFSDAATRRAALELFGGWRALCERLPAEGPELLGWAKQFKAIYISYARLEERDGRQAAHRISAGTEHCLPARAEVEAPLNREEAAVLLAKVEAQVLSLRTPRKRTRPGPGHGATNLESQQKTN
jgi:hypothetical protein